MCCWACTWRRGDALQLQQFLKVIEASYMTLAGYLTTGVIKCLTAFDVQWFLFQY
jgi:hypothetical protein